MKLGVFTVLFSQQSLDDALDCICLFGGSEETHEVMQEKAVKFNEKLRERGWRLEEILGNEFRDIAHEIGLADKNLPPVPPKGGCPIGLIGPGKTTSLEVVADWFPREAVGPAAGPAAHHRSQGRREHRHLLREGSGCGG